MISSRDFAASPICTWPSFQLCAGAHCTTHVRLHRFCDACLTTAAIEVAQAAELRLRREFAEAWRPQARSLDAAAMDRKIAEDVRVALAGYAQGLPNKWFVQHSGLGHLSYCEAIILRGKTDQACFLVAQGGVKALSEMQRPMPAHALSDPDEEDELPVSPASFFSRIPVGADTGLVELQAGEELVASPGLRSLVFGAAAGAITVLLMIVFAIGVMCW